MDSVCGYDDFLSLVKARRSVRHFRPDPIPDGYVEKMIEVARWAPSGFHSQPWEFVVIRDPAVKGQVAAAVKHSASPAPAMRARPSLLSRRESPVSPMPLSSSFSWATGGPASSSP